MVLSPSPMQSQPIRNCSELSCFASLAAVRAVTTPVNSMSVNGPEMGHAVRTASPLRLPRSFNFRKRSLASLDTPA